MSNRTIEQVNQLAARKVAYIACYQAQIEVLTRPGLRRIECLSKFGELINGGDYFIMRVVEARGIFGGSRAFLAWNCSGFAVKSLFADLPGCYCPVIEVVGGRAKFSGIPKLIPYKWTPTVADLEPFMEVQLEKRFPVLNG